MAEGEADTRSRDACWRLPFERPRMCCGVFTSPAVGLCIQGNHGAVTHQGELCYAYDWAMPSGTAVLAARKGVVPSPHIVRRASLISTRLRPFLLAAAPNARQTARIRRAEAALRPRPTVQVTPSTHADASLRHAHG